MMIKLGRTRKALIAVLFSLLIAAAAAFTFSACSSDEKALDKIEVTTPPAKVEYVEGEKFNPDGMVVTAYYTDKTEAAVTGYTFRPDADTELDTTYTKVTVFYTEDGVTKSADIAITVTTPPDPVEVTVKEVKVTKNPKTEYEAGEKFSIIGMEWEVTYSDDSKKTVKFTEDTENVELSITRALMVTDEEVSVTYLGKTVKIAITVTEPEVTVKSVEVKTYPKTEYNAGERFSIIGMVWEVTYSDDTTENVTFTADTENVELSITRALMVTDEEVSVTYLGKTVKIEITVTAITIEDHEILAEPEKTDYFEGEAIVIYGLVVNFIYSDGTEEEVTFTSETEDYTVTPAIFDENPQGNPNYTYPDHVTVTYKGYSFDVELLIRYPRLTELKVTKQPNKTRYIAGEYFSKAGMEITLIWEDDFELAHSENMVYFKNVNVPLKAGDTFVVAYYRDAYYGNEVTVNIPVTVVSIESLTVSGTYKTEYVAGESFDATGMILSVVYSDGESEDIEVNKATEYLVLPENALTTSDEYVILSYRGYEFEIAVRILKGVFIEAEDAVISGAHRIQTDAVDRNGVPNANGGKYVSDLTAGGSVSFNFYADKAGTGELAFVLASKYLKRDIWWNPKEMGDCQFNLICEFTVNGEKYDIPDSVILPGGKVDNDDEDGLWLWFNWKEVVFEGVEFIQGVNKVVLTFIPHNISDCSQSDFNGTFTANVDSLKVTPDDCEVSACKLTYETYNADIANNGGKAQLVIIGSYEAEHYTDEDVKEILAGVHFDLQRNEAVLENWSGSWQSFDLEAAEIYIEDGIFMIFFDLDTLADYYYTAHFGMGFNNENKWTAADFRIDTSKNKSIEAGEKKYTLISVPGSSEGSEFWGCVGVIIEPKS